MKDFRIERLEIPDESKKILQDYYLPLVLQESKNSDHSVSKSNAGGWQSPDFTFNFDTDEPIKELAIPVFNRLNQLISGLTPRGDMELAFQYWFNVNYTNDYNSYHHHHDSLLSGCYYLQKPKNSGNIIFRSDDRYLVKYFIENFDDEVECEEGDCLIFKSRLYHAVEMNKSILPRVSIAFNIYS